MSLNVRCILFMSTVFVSRSICKRSLLETFSMSVFLQNFQLVLDSVRLFFCLTVYLLSFVLLNTMEWIQCWQIPKLNMNGDWMHFQYFYFISTTIKDSMFVLFWKLNFKQARNRKQQQQRKKCTIIVGI